MSASRILAPGSNCDRLVRAYRIGFLIDGADYFEAVSQALSRARHQVFIIGWDFDSRIRLRPDGPTLAEELLTALERAPDLHLNILIWRSSLVYGANSEFNLTGSSWRDHPRVHFVHDGLHPVAACHHQKIVTVDDTLAFLGGMDLTAERWDTHEHKPDDPRRINTVGQPYVPVHDVQVAVTGPAARAVAAVARDRWRAVTGHEVPVVPRQLFRWPPRLRVALRNHDVAIAQTRPDHADAPEIRHAEQLTLDCLRAAKRRIYIESQYFSFDAAADILADHLSRPDGPEIIILTTKKSKGRIEQFVMAENRDRLFSQLEALDHHNRLQVVYAVACPEPECEVKIHSKLIVVDDRFVRIGSSNLNYRSMGLDTECDLAIEARTPLARFATRRLLCRLLGEHCGTDARTFALAMRATGSMLGALRILNGRFARRLTAFEPPPTDGTVTAPVASALFDPERPLTWGYFWRLLIGRWRERLIGLRDRATGRAALNRLAAPADEPGKPTPTPH